MQKPLWVRMCPLSNHNLENAFPQILQEHGKVCVLRCIFRAPWLLNVWSFIGIFCRTNVSFSLSFSPSALFALLSPVFPAHFHSNRWVLWCFVTLTIKCFDFFFFFSYLSLSLFNTSNSSPVCFVTVLTDVFQLPIDVILQMTPQSEEWQIGLVAMQALKLNNWNDTIVNGWSSEAPQNIKIKALVICLIQNQQTVR